jgi:hypothetical protein
VKNRRQGYGLNPDGGFLTRQRFSLSRFNIKKY